MYIAKIEPKSKLPGKNTQGCLINTELFGTLELVANPSWNAKWLAANRERITAPLFIFGPGDRKRGEYDGTGSVWWEPTKKHLGRFQAKPTTSVDETTGEITTAAGKVYEVTIEITDPATYEGLMTFVEYSAPEESALV